MRTEKGSVTILPVLPSSPALLALLAIVISMAAGGRVAAQTRATDQRLVQLLARLEGHSNKFAASFDAALDRMVLEGGMRKDDALALLDEFEAETDQLCRRVDDDQVMVSDVERILIRATALELFVQRQRLNRSVQNDWANVRWALMQLAKRYGLEWVWNPQPDTRLKTLPLRQIVHRIDLRNDDFLSSLKDALGRRPLNNTEARSKALSLVGNLERAATRLRSRLDHDPGAQPAAETETLLKSALEVDQFMRSHPLTARAQRDWSRVKVQLDDFAQASNITWGWAMKSGRHSTTASARARPEAAGTIADVVIIETTTARPELIGRRVQLSNVRIESIANERTFWIGPNYNQQLLVVVDEGPVPEVNIGRIVTINGTFKRMPSADQAQQQWGLSAAMANATKQDIIYLEADRVDGRN